SSRRSGSSSKTAAPSASSTSRHFATTKGMSSSSSRRAARAQPTSWSSRTRDTSSSTSAVYTQLGCGFNGRGTDATWSRSRTPGTAWHQRPDRRQRVRSRTVVHDRVEVPDVRDAEGEFVVAQPYRRAHHDAVQLHDPPAALVGKAVLYRPQGHAVKPRDVSDRDPALYTNPRHASWSPSSHAFWKSETACSPFAGTPRPPSPRRAACSRARCRPHKHTGRARLRASRCGPRACRWRSRAQLRPRHREQQVGPRYHLPLESG